MNRALLHLTGGALLVVCIEAADGTHPAAIPLAIAVSLLAIAGFRWVQHRGRALAAGYVVLQLALGYGLFAAVGAGVGATLLLVVLVIQAVLLLPLPWAIVVAALVPLMHLGMPWRDAAREATITIVVVAFAVVLAALYLDVQRARTELAAANAQLRTYADQAESLATAAERTRLAREIHDGLGHHLTVVQMQVRAARAVLPADHDRADALLDKAEDQSRAALAEVRRSVAALREPWETGPVSRAIEALTAESAGASVEVRGEHRALPPDAERTLYRAAQEALTNVRKHAAGATARVLLDYTDPGVVVLRVADDGQGLPVAAGNGYGLTGVRERVSRLGGTVELESRPGAGVTMTVAVPG